MEINKEELQTMIREYWAVDNNELCLKMTVIFLRFQGVSDKEIINIIDLRAWGERLPTITEDDMEDFKQSVEDTKDYFSQDFALCVEGEE